VTVVSPADPGIRQARARTDRLDARVLAELVWAGELDGVWRPDEQTRGLRRRLAQREQLVGARGGRRTRCPRCWCASSWAARRALICSGSRAASGGGSSSCRRRRASRSRRRAPRRVLDAEIAQLEGKIAKQVLLLADARELLTSRRAAPGGQGEPDLRDQPGDPRSRAKARPTGRSLLPADAPRLAGISAQERKRARA